MLDPIAGHLAIQQTRELARSALPDAPVRRQPEPAAARPLRRWTALEGPRAGLDLLATLDGEPLLRGSHRLDAVRSPPGPSGSPSKPRKSLRGRNRS